MTQRRSLKPVAAPRQNRAPLRATTDGLWTVVLAAGGSRRLGFAKQLLRHEGRTLLHRTADIALASTPGRVVVVVGAEHLKLRRHLRTTGLAVDVRRNAGWQAGMAASLACGLRALPRTALAALVLVTDQPLIRLPDIGRLIRRWAARPARPAASVYAVRLGVPAIVPRRHFPALARLTGDTGARHLLRSLPGVARVPLPAAACDIDTPDDAARLRARRVRR